MATNQPVNSVDRRSPGIDTFPVCRSLKLRPRSLHIRALASNRESDSKEREMTGSGRDLGIWLPVMDTFRTISLQAHGVMSSDRGEHMRFPVGIPEPGPSALPISWLT